MLAPDFCHTFFDTLLSVFHAPMMECSTYSVFLSYHTVYLLVLNLTFSNYLPLTNVCCHRQMMDPSWKNQDLVPWLPSVRNRFLLEH
jgi:hypothetical protein